MDNFLSLFGSSSQGVLLDSLAFAYILIVIIAPFVLAVMFFEAYVTLRRNQFIHSQKTIVLAITLPQEILKSPLAMELFLTSLYQTKGEGTFIARLIKGQVRPWFSLELVSDGGNIKFYIWTWSFWKHLVESQLYAQYPDIEIKEVKDYAENVHLDFNKMDLWGCNFKLSKADHFPIKTYVDYNLDKDPKEEVKIDPMTPVLEYLGGLRKGEHAWIQIIIRAHKKERPKPGAGWFSREKVDWTHHGKEEIKHIKQGDKQEAGEIKLTGISLTKGERDVIEAIEKNIAKIAFDCGIRALYFADKGAFNDINIAGLNGSFRQYNATNLNGFESDHATSFDYPWQDFTGKKLKHKKEHMLHEYQSRSFFHSPHQGHFFTMNTESLATIYHFPGQVARTPTISRVEAKKSEAPANLPI